MRLRLLSPILRVPLPPHSLAGQLLMSDPGQRVPLIGFPSNLFALVGQPTKRPQIGTGATTMRTPLGADKKLDFPAPDTCCIVVNSAAVDARLRSLSPSRAINWIDPQTAQHPLLDIHTQISSRRKELSHPLRPTYSSLPF